MKLLGVKSGLKINESWIFLFVALVNLMPLFAGKFFPTLDGAAHLYNAGIVKELLFNSNSAFHNYFVFNSQPIPNWTGHFALMLFQLILPAFAAEKLLLLIYLLGLPYAFRSLVIRINPGNTIGSYLIFPFCYTTVFLFGFYNFSIGILLMFIVLSSWLKWEHKKHSVKKYGLFFLLLNLLYFSHLVVFLITIGLLIGRSVYLVLWNLFHKKSTSGSKEFSHFYQLGFLLFSSILPIALTGNYFVSRSFFSSTKSLGYDKLFNSLVELESIIGFSYDYEKEMTSYIFGALIIIVVGIIITRLSRVVKKGEGFIKQDYWLLAAIAVLVMYFTIPNESGGAGFVSIRLNLIFYLLLICWIAAQKINNYLAGLAIIVILTSNIILNLFYFKVSKDLNSDVKEITNSAMYLKSGSTVLPLRLTDHWLMGHFSNYLGVDKPLFIFENYEAVSGLFPLEYRNQNLPIIEIVDNVCDNFNYLQWISDPYFDQTSIPNYIMTYGKLSDLECQKILVMNINQRYKLTYKNEFVTIYSRNEAIEN